MPNQTRLGDVAMPNGGHIAFPAVSSVAGSPNVFCNSLAVVRQGDDYSVHCLGNYCHTPVQGTTSGTVYANSLPCGRLGDETDCGMMVGTASYDTFSGD